MATSDLANSITTYVNQYGCDCTQSLATITRAFQISYNNDVAAGTYAGPILTVDGEYGTESSNAAQQVVGSAAAAPCYSIGNPCYQKGILPGGGTVPVGLPPVGVTPGGGVTIPPVSTPPASGTPSSTSSSSSSSAFAKATPWLIGAVAVAAGVGLVALAKHHGTLPTVASKTHKPARKSMHSLHARRSHR